MSDRLTLELVGVDVALAKLKTLDARIRKNAVRRAVRSGTNVLRDEARRQAPRRTGALKAAIRSAVSGRIGKPITGKVFVKSSAAQKRKGRDAYYAHFVAGGTRPHVIRARHAKALATGREPRAAVQHPGARPNPFFDRALAAAQSKAVRTFALELGRETDAEVAKLA